MEHHMRKLAAVYSDTNTASSTSSSASMAPTHKKLPKSQNSSSAATKKTHHAINSDLAGDIDNLSVHFSKLHINQLSKPRIDNEFQPKLGLISSIEGSRSTKSNQQQQRQIVAEIEGFHEIHHDVKKAFRDEAKRLSKKDSKKKEFHEAKDVKKLFLSLSKSQDSGLKEAREGTGLTKRPSFSLSSAVAGGRRRSSCNCQSDQLADFFSCTGVKVVSVDMPPFMQVHAVDCARKTYDSLEKFTAKTLALTLKKEFDGVYGPAWHCIVGTSFGSFVTHSVGGFLYFSMDHKLYILLFKTTVLRAED